MRSEIDYKLLGEKIHSVRKSKDITQEQLSEIVGCNTSHISNIENNYTKPSLNVLLAIANALDTTIDFLLFDQYDNLSLAIDKEIMHKLSKCDEKKKMKILQMIDVI